MPWSALIRFKLPHSTLQGRVVPAEDSLSQEWWETRARLGSGGLLGAGCQVLFIVLVREIIREFGWWIDTGCQILLKRGSSADFQNTRMYPPYPLPMAMTLSNSGQAEQNLTCHLQRHQFNLIGCHAAGRVRRRKSGQCKTAWPASRPCPQVYIWENNFPPLNDKPSGPTTKGKCSQSLEVLVEELRFALPMSLSSFTFRWH